MSKNYYITTPIYYPSGKPHMGNAYSSIIAAIFARFKRLEGYKVLFLTGTDEHGQKIQKEADKNKKDPKKFCDEISGTFRSLTKVLNLSNNDFIRTTETRHFKSVNEIWKRLTKSGDIYLDKYSGWYSVSDEAYYDKDEIEEINGKKISKTSGSSVEWVEEESYFFKLSAFQKRLLEHYKKNERLYIKIGGLDLLDGTPILDIKPYIPYADSIPEAVGGYASKCPKPKLLVKFSEKAESELQVLEAERENLRSLILEAFALDPRPAWRVKTSDSKQYGVTLYDINIKFEFDIDVILITALDKTVYKV